MSDEVLKSIDGKLSLILKIMVKNDIEGLTNTESAPLLKNIGFTIAEIAEIIGSTPGSVRVTLNRIQKKGT